MTFDKWFKDQSRLVQIVLLLIPFVNYVVEILVRISAFIRKNSTMNLIGIILFVLPWGFIIAYLDLIWVLLFKTLFILE